MGFDQYHEPPNELSQETRTFARMITSLIEEAEAISWYEQRMAVEKDKFPWQTQPNKPPRATERYDRWRAASKFIPARVSATARPRGDARLGQGRV
jgi:hypothetical protein